MVKVENFNNGFRLVYERRDSKISHGCLLIGVGSRCEDERQIGFSHLIEHLLFKRTVKRNYFQIADSIESYGGDVNAYTTKEDTLLYASIADDFFENIVDVFSDVVFNSVFDESDIGKEIEIVKDEIDYYKDSPSESIYDDFEEIYYKGSSLSHNILGRGDSFDLLQRDFLFAYYKQYYRLDNMVFSYVGSLSYEKVVDLIKKYFVSISLARISSVDKSVFPVCCSGFKQIIDKDLNQSHCIIGNKTVDAFSDYRMCVVLLNAFIAGSSFNSLLNQKLREERGLTYNIDSNYSQYFGTGLFTLYFGTDKSKIDECLHIIESEFDNLVRNGLKDELLKKWKIQLKGQLLLHYDSGSNIAITNAKHLMVYDRAYTINDIMEQINDVSVDKINEIIKQTLLFSDFSVLQYT